MTAIFFDLDGTLVDTRTDLAAAVNHTRQDYGLEAIAQAEVLRHVGQGAKYLLTNAIPEKAAEFEQVWAHFRERYKEHMQDAAVLYPTVGETLEALKSCGYLLGVNTAKPSFATHALLKHLGILDYFGSAIVAGGDCPEMKPSPLPLRQCADLMGHTLTPQDWMVGDHWTDMKCAVNAGIQGAFCDFGFGVLDDASYTIRLNQMADLLPVLDTFDTQGALRVGP